MKCLLSVCLLALGVAAGVATNDLGQARAPRKGVSVKMAASKTATAMPAADNEKAWIVTVAANDDVYFGIRKLKLDDLTDVMKTIPRNREQNLYIKADARASFATVRRVLEAAKDLEFDAPVLLTAQPTSHIPGVMVPPMGFEVAVRAETEDAAVVEVIGSGQHLEARVGGKVVALADLQNAVREALQSRTEKTEKVVRLKADGAAHFEEVVQILDACHGAGAKVLIPTPAV